jgi:hypothetical protein
LMKSTACGNADEPRSPRAATTRRATSRKRSEYENSRADDRADSQRDQIVRPQRANQSLLAVRSRFGEQLIERLGGKQL